MGGPGSAAAGDAPQQDTSEQASSGGGKSRFPVYNTIHACQTGRVRLIGGVSLPFCLQIYISSLALLKMLKHGRAGVPLEVMGLMLGEFVDEYTVKVVDVFAMPQSGTGVSVEAVDPVFQTKMLDMLKQVGR
jgi:hypothetical protein